jgi:hypothetical protein
MEILSGRSYYSGMQTGLRMSVKTQERTWYHEEISKDGKTTYRTIVATIDCAFLPGVIGRSTGLL